MAHLIALELERLASVDVEHVHKSEMTDFLGISEEEFLYVFPPRWQNQVEFYNIHTLAERCVEECPQVPDRWTSLINSYLSLIHCGCRNGMLVSLSRPQFVELQYFSGSGDRAVFVPEV